MKKFLSPGFLLSFISLFLVSFSVGSLFAQSQKVAHQEGVVLGDLLAKSEDEENKEEEKEEDKGEEGEKNEDREEDHEEDKSDNDAKGSEGEDGKEIEVKNEDDGNGGKEEYEEESKDGEEDEDEERIEIKQEDDRTEIRIKKEGEEEKRFEIREKKEKESEKEVEEGKEEEIKFMGTVSSITDTVWVVSGRSVNIGTFVKIQGNPQVGSLVKVEADTQPDGSLLAKEIELEEEEGLENITEFKGIVESISASTWVVSGRTVVTSDSTELEGSPKVGVLVRVEGTLQDDGSILAKEVGSQEEESELKMEQEAGKTKIKIKTGGVEREFRLDEKEGKTLLRMKLEDEITGDKSDFEIKVRQDKFEIKHRGTTATTAFPLSINPETNQLSVTTPAGTVVVETLPSEAIESTLNGGLADKVTQAEIVENEQSVAIKILGSKKKKFLGLFNMEVPLEIKVDAVSGDTLNIAQPFIFRTLGFLFR